jgi:hypothetical protein
MELICGKKCPVALARAKVLEVTKGLNENPGDEEWRWLTIEEKIARYLGDMSFGGALESQSCKGSCRVMRAILYSTGVDGHAVEVVQDLPKLGPEI